MSPSELRQTIAELWRKAADPQSVQSAGYRDAMEALRDTIETFFTPDGQGVCPVFDRDALKTVLDRLSEVRHA